MLKRPFIAIAVFFSVLSTFQQLLSGRKKHRRTARDGGFAVMGFQEFKTALLQAASNGDMTAVKIVITCAKTSQITSDLVNTQDDDGHTSLMLAAVEGHKSIVHYLLEHGANPRIKSNEGRTALIYAASKGHAKIVSALIRSDKGCVDERDAQGYSALIVAICQDQLEVVQKLLRANQAIAQKKVLCLSPLILAIHHASDDLIKLLLDAGASANEATDCGNNALLFAAKNDRAYAVQLLIDHGAHVNAANGKGDTALLVAARNGSQNACKTLISGGALVDKSNKLGDGPLHCAAANGYASVVRFLLEQDANVDLKNRMRITPLMSALSAKSSETVQCLLQAGADVHARMIGCSVLQVALERSSRECLELVLDAGQFDLEEKDSEGRTLLMQAIECNNAHAFVALLRGGAKPNICNKKGETPLTLAVRKKNAAIALSLLERKKTDKNHQNGQGQTPLMLATLIGHRGLCAHLLQLGARVDLVDKKSRTALDYAIAVRNSDIARELLQRMHPPFPVKKLEKIGIKIASEQAYAEKHC